MKKFFIGILIFIAAIGVAAILVLGYFGFIPGVSAVFGSNKPRDLGVTYTQQDYKNAYAKGGEDVLVNKLGVTAEDSLVVRGQQEVNDSWTGAEITAVINEHQENWAYYPVSDVQVRINDDGTMDVSGYLLKDRLEAYARATGVTDDEIEAARPYVHNLPTKIPTYVHLVTSAEKDSVNVNLMEAEVGRFNIPGNTTALLNDIAGDFLANQLNAFDITINSASISNGRVHFDGTLPKTISTYAE